MDCNKVIRDFTVGGNFMQIKKQLHKIKRLKQSRGQKTKI